MNQEDAKMSETTNLKGKCYICRKELSKDAMKNHLLKCHKPAKGRTNYFVIMVEDFHSKNYWLYIQIKGTATLADLDLFLRAIWLECCGHLSCFTIDDKIYDCGAGGLMNPFWGEESDDMENYRLKDILTNNMVFKHEYDFGSTTTLKLTVVGTYTGSSTKCKITVLSRNNKHEYICEKCGKEAAYILLGDTWNDFHPLCKDCLESCEDEAEEIITITNSPRMGVCDYNGDYDVYELD